MYYMKKKIFVCITCLLGCIISTSAQGNWKVIITKNDGTVEELLTSDIADITFASVAGQEEDVPYLPDQNADQVIIKELYNGGVMLDDGSKNFQFDKCVILYNNCPQRAVVNNLCFGVLPPYNSFGQHDNFYGNDGRLLYEGEGFLPIIHSLWYYPHSLVIEPYSQVVINICGAIDNTQTVSNSVNYANADYYCMYDPEAGYTHTGYYPTPASVIPTSHYLKGIMIGMGNGWTFSVSSPALIVFQTQGITPQEFGNDADNLWYGNAATTQVNACLKVPSEWVIDGLEVYGSADREKNQKRLTADVDAGYVYLTNQLGHVLYRNVDKEETEALPENQGKLVYNYALGVDDSTDPSGIDAEASMKQGAHIVYQDTNNSSADFHERLRCSLRD